ncbi:hypothetical protein U8C32_11620 [Sinorhizobium medicae]|uniref:hypothetical protein n=1 Tax=Sinorhizobium medicae TaxID=110321 RepID=UPI002AF6BEEA|nr:hypothetical protein [Sinorhizobium medicae]WQO47233.1 hypothetical protein U8C42_10110 [Sinorhizobium medicae]WQO67440.1 hypothetical protein U8C40_10180 [Sinorhizobium medicae]WQO74593.1 hypothetical protein U8C31_10240 [Sinorhizobium medicae]WQO90509.1 hypothetical protein U8C32_11620 [Sinorhizobium medicae]
MDPVLLVAEVRSGQNSRLTGPNILSYGTWQSDLISAINAYASRPERDLAMENDADAATKYWSRVAREEVRQSSRWSGLPTMLFECPDIGEPSSGDAYELR